MQSLSERRLRTTMLLFVEAVEHHIRLHHMTGAATTFSQHPELMGVAVIRFGFSDMLRYHEFGTAEHYESEYLKATNRVGFETLYAYSPLHNITRRQYPAVLCLTGCDDERVAAIHSCKFVATLQANQQGTNPTLLFALKGTGHYFSN